MWVLMNDAFFSVVQHREEKDVLVVRARVREDLIAAFSVEADSIIESTDSDYRFRIFVTRRELKKALSTYIDDYLDYDNFKGSIHPKDKLRYSVYMSVWAVLLKWQEKIYGKQEMNWIDQYYQEKEERYEDDDLDSPYY